MSAAVIIGTGVLGLAAVIVLTGWLMNRPDHHDPFAAPQLTPEDHLAGLGKRPSEMAHEQAPFEVPAFLPAPLETSLAAEVPFGAPRETGPGTAAAADEGPPSPPPLPEPVTGPLAAVAAIAAQFAAPADEERWPWLAGGQYEHPTGWFTAICADGAP